MADRVPMALLVDDSCPLIHVYRNQIVDLGKRPPTTRDGRPLLETIPNSFLDHFCDVVERRGIAGKLSIVPAPAGRGDVVRGIEGYDVSLTRTWLDTAKARLGRRFDFTPEMVTHDLALDLATGTSLEESESEWSQRQDRTALTPYLVRALELLKDAGVEASGVTSPWVFGEQVEAEYLAAMAEAQKAVYGHDMSWYYLHIWDRYPSARPHIAYARGDTTIVSINSTVDDYIWQAIDSPRTDREFIEAVADQLLTVDGRAGSIRAVLDAGGWPVLMTHWQGYFSNGLETGLAILDLVGERVANALADEVEWVSCLEMARRTVAGWRP